MKNDFQNQLDEIEVLIRSAKGEKARALLLELHEKKVPVNLLLQMAGLARRANLPELGVRLLNPIVRPKAKMKREASAKDIVEYAASLMRIGASKEASDLLETVDPTAVPEALLFRAMLLLKKWNYAEALPLLRRYLAIPEISEYQRAIGKINLGLTLIHENHLGEAKSVLSEVLEECSAKRYDLLHGNALRFLGNLEIARKNWEVGIEYFRQSENLLTDAKGLDYYFCKKWVAIAKFYLNPKSHECRTELDKMRDEARRLHHWESVRDLDYHQALVSRDTKLFELLYFGTPFPSFRARVTKDWKRPEGETTYHWKMGSGEAHYIDIAMEQKTAQGGFLKAGQSMHRLYVALTSDFYRPFTIAELYEQVFPEEFYCPGVSEFRVHQAMKRLRKWFEQNKIPLQIESVDGEYRLTTDECVEILIHEGGKIQTSGDFRLQFLKTQLGEEFSIKDAVPLLKLTRRRAGEVIQEAVLSGILTKVGKGNRTRYRFVSSTTPLKKAS